MAALLLGSSAAGTAAEFVLTNGKIIKGEVIQVTRNTLVIRPKRGGIRQLSRRQMKSVRIETKDGEVISGPLKNWQDGVYEIESDGQLVEVRNRTVVRDPSTTPTTQTVAEAKSVKDAASPENSAVAVAEAEVVEDATLLQTPTGSESEAVVDVPPPPERVGRETAYLQDSQSKAGENATPQPKPAGSEAEVAEGVTPPPKLTVSRAEADENATEMVFKLVLSRPSKEPILILYATFNQTANAGEDYHGERGTLKLAPGKSSAVVRVPLINDDVSESNETLELFVTTDKRHAIVEFERTVGTILNDDD